MALAVVRVDPKGRWVSGAWGEVFGRGAVRETVMGSAMLGSGAGSRGSDTSRNPLGVSSVTGSLRMCVVTATSEMSRASSSGVGGVRSPGVSPEAGGVGSPNVVRAGLPGGGGVGSPKVGRPGSPDEGGTASADVGGAVGSSKRRGGANSPEVGGCRVGSPGVGVRLPGLGWGVRAFGGGGSGCWVGQ